MKKAVLIAVALLVFSGSASANTLVWLGDVVTKVCDELGLLPIVAAPEVPATPETTTDPGLTGGPTPTEPPPAVDGDPDDIIDGNRGGG